MFRTFSLRSVRLVLCGTDFKFIGAQLKEIYIAILKHIFQTVTAVVIRHTFSLKLSSFVVFEVAISHNLFL